MAVQFFFHHSYSILGAPVMYINDVQDQRQRAASLAHKRAACRIYPLGKKAQQFGLVGIIDGCAAHHECSKSAAAPNCKLHERTCSWDACMCSKYEWDWVFGEGQRWLHCGHFDMLFEHGHYSTKVSKRPPITIRTTMHCRCTGMSCRASTFMYYGTK